MNLNPFKKKKAKDEKVSKKVTKENIKAFLKEVTQSIDVTFSGKESVALEQQLQKEIDLWLKETIFANKELDLQAIKLGICLGIRESLRKINEAEEERRVTYIS